MYRHFYILCILFAIKWNFCYNYIYDDNLKYKSEILPFKKAKIQRPRLEAKSNVHKKQAEHEITNNKDDVVQIDVDSFIHKPDEYAIEDNILYEEDVKKIRANLKNYDEYGSLGEINMAEDIRKSENSPYLNSAAENPNYKDFMDPRYLNYNPLSLQRMHNPKSIRNVDSKLSNLNKISNMDNKLVQKQEKKSSFKHMKIPFFSHDKSDLQKNTKDKKRKFCFKCQKKENKNNEIVTEAIKDTTKKESLTVSASNKETGENHQTSIKPNRQRRGNDDWMEDRERQLKQLDEIQKKIDGVKISSSNDQKEN